ncbi:helix-turn-helix transcriptional regulator [Paractinoplanes abujensis]|uniref:DNA-binding CsgD family transcriptional regulator n=1 Tax=Paractinoplanes abujensis TaxID=882441 RepID=A0A7W7D0N7_9ACTN|nr:LuxR family transcriptional regulator [Actinoplanes abujensis]MBB4698098.1 DNA-binding CsgD family transcriptional regulator [Actinoplanes abujensis]GID19415.1 helix-turn-helix transcriptional regulator [Actinoplanes abujensis]
MGVRLVGRVAEVVALDRLRAAALQGTGGMVLLVGEAGIGKTAVVEEAAARAAAAGMTVLTGRADPDEGAPSFWPWTTLLRDAPAGLSPALLTPAGSDASAAPARFQAVQATVAALIEVASKHPMMLVLEDLHWADAASLALLTALTRELAGSRILVTATSRDAGAGLDAEVLPIGPWDAAAVRDYLAQSADRVHPSWTAALHRLGGGSPLYTRELVRLLSREGKLSGPAGAVDLPDGLRRLVARRTGQLTPACRVMLATAAAYGADIDVAILEKVVPVAAVGEAVAAGVLVDDPWAPARVRFGHELVRQALYDGLGRDERIRAHAAIAAALEGNCGSLAEIARHRVRAAVDDDSRARATAACVAAAQEATRGLDHSEAVHWLGRALDTTPGDARLRLERARAAYRNGQLDVALNDCASVVDEVGAAAALVIRGLGGPLAPALLRLCERALAQDLGHADRAKVLSQYAFLLAEDRDPERAERMSREAMALAEASQRPDALVAAVHARHETIDPVARIDETRTLARRSCDLAGPSGQPDAELWGRTWLLDSYLATGELAEFDAETNRLSALVDRLGWPVARWHLLRARAARALIAGRLTAAYDHATEARDLAVRSQDRSAPYLYLAFLSGLAALTGDYAWADPPAFGDEDMPIALAQIGQIAMGRGDRDAARDAIRRLRPALPRLPADGRRTFVTVVAGEVAAWLGDLELAADCYTRSLPRAELYLNSMSSCHGAISRSLGTIAAALGDPAASRHLAGAVAMEERIGAPAFLAQAQIACAASLRGSEPRRCRELASAALATARRLGLTALIDPATALARDDLTAREREIAALVAQGLSNRAIASRLVLSERTVETHVRNILSKLGLSGRAGLRGSSQYQH